MYYHIWILLVKALYTSYFSEVNIKWEMYREYSGWGNIIKSETINVLGGDFFERGKIAGTF